MSPSVSAAETACVGTSANRDDGVEGVRDSALSSLSMTVAVTARD